MGIRAAPRQTGRPLYATLGVGYNYDRDQHDVNWQLSGGGSGMKNGITLSQPLGDTNVLIKAPGAGGVRIENQTGILTDWRGYAGDAVCHGLSV